MDGSDNTNNSPTQGSATPGSTEEENVTREKESNTDDGTTCSVTKNSVARDLNDSAAAADGSFTGKEAKVSEASGKTTTVSVPDDQAAADDDALKGKEHEKAAQPPPKSQDEPTSVFTDLLPELLLPVTPIAPFPRNRNSRPDSLPGAYARSNPRPIPPTPSTRGRNIPTTSSGLVHTTSNTTAHNDPNLVEANLVTELDHESPTDLMHANPVNLEEQEERQQEHKKQQRTMIFILVLVVLGGGIIIGTVAGTASKELDSQPSHDGPINTSLSLGPSAVPSSAPTGVLDDLLVNRLPNHTLTALQQYGTAQWKAWDWLANHQHLANLPEWRKQQLFAMATFFYSFGGENWWKPIQDRWMDETLDECLWYSGGYGYFDPGPDWTPNTGDEDGSFVEFEDDALYRLAPCNDLGQLTRLDVSNLGLNGFHPTLPQELALLTSLNEVSLGFSGFEANLLDLLPWGLPPTLRILYLSDALKGSLPTEVGALFQNLTDVGIPRNSLTGTVPSEFALLTDLDGEVNFNRNYFSGSIPAELASMSNIGSWWIPRNNFGGQNPSEFGLGKSLSSINVEETLLSPASYLL